MQTNSPDSVQEGQKAPIANKDKPFLEKVMEKSGLSDIYDARDITEVVFRTMRDMMTTEAADRVADELHEPAQVNDDTKLHEVADLWKDTNPIVAFLSRVRPPLIIKADTFLFRIQQEAGLQPGVNVERAIKGVFSATKDELSEDRIKEISEFLPDKIRQLWQEA